MIEKLTKFFSLHIKTIHRELLLGRWSILETPPYIYKYMDNDKTPSINTNHTQTKNHENCTMKKSNCLKYNNVGIKQNNY